MEVIKNIIFDLGGVLLDLYIDRTEAGFRSLLGDNSAYNEATMTLAKAQVFENIETGAISEEIFVKALQEVNSNPVTRGQIEIAWNAMLGDFPARSLDLMKKLKEAGFNLYLLSNTNSIHLKAFREIVLEQHGIEDFDAFFTKAYYSHLVGLRKPHAEIYQYVLDDAGLLAEETIFIDDTAANLVGARQVGLHTLWHPRNTNTYEHLTNYLEL